MKKGEKKTKCLGLIENVKFTIVCPKGELLVVNDGELENMFPNPVEGLLKMLLWPNAGVLLCPNCPKAEPVCPNTEPVCPVEGVELNRVDG